ncbi:MAG: hypothetical protein CVV37_08460 [Nitrospira bacterium HGW-Nitrospira-1]|nr:MAG: hypothetical protein CVV37_08460 [Nitrospira bacterium HGW-Nitrospira-1]
MEGHDIIVLKQRELKRLHVIHKALDEALKQAEAAEMLSLSDRQIRRIIKKARVVKEMRLKGIKSIEEANKFLASYLPLYNRKFAVNPKEKEDIHRDILSMRI